MTDPTAGHHPAAPGHPTAPPPYPSTPPPYPSAPPPYPTTPPHTPPTTEHPPKQTVPPPRRPAAPEPDLGFRTGRIHLSARQRGADATAIGQLLLFAPNFIGSLVVIYAISALLPTVLGWALIAGWIASGALVFHRPTERFLARHLYRFRLPTHAELDLLMPLWREVTARAGVDGSAYELWIENNDHMNAYAAAGHIVGVTQHALDELTPAQLAGVLAHELGHHTGGHPWAGLLGFWYALPGRYAWWLLQFVTLLLFGLVSQVSWVVTAVLVVVVAAVAISVAVTMPVLLLVFVTPYLLAAVGRRAELRADLHAAELGFAPALLEVLQVERMAVEAAEAEARRPGTNAVRQSAVDRLLATHPDTYTRIRRLEDYQALGR